MGSVDFRAILQLFKYRVVKYRPRGMDVGVGFVIGVHFAVTFLYDKFDVDIDYAETICRYKI